MPREVKTVFSNGPTLFKFDNKESGKQILNIITNNFDKISKENQIIIKNILGYSLIIGGIMMLVLPGQGLFTIIIGLMLSNYPGKYYIEKRFVEIPAVFKSINWLRAKSNKPPIILK